MCVNLTGLEIDAAGDRQTFLLKVTQEGAEGSVVAGQLISMQMM